MDFTYIYETMSHLNLIDKDDIILYLSSQKDIMKKISSKRRDLQSCYYLYDDKIRTIHRFLKYVLFRNRIRDIIATTKLDKSEYVNTETLLGIPIEEIKSKLFISFQDNGFKYAFDIRELDKLIDYKLQNPYNNALIPKDVIKQVKRLMRNKNFGDILAYIQMSIPLNSNESAKIASLFNKLSSLFVYPDVRRFLKFTAKQYLYFIQDLRTNNLIDDHVSTIQYSLLVDAQNEGNLNRTRKIVLDILLKILDVGDNNTYTRALIISEQILNTNTTSDSDSDNDSDNDNDNHRRTITRNPLFTRRQNTLTRMSTRRRRLFRSNRTRVLRQPPTRPPPDPPQPPGIRPRNEVPQLEPLPPATPPPLILSNSLPNLSPPIIPPLNIIENIVGNTEIVINNLENNDTSRNNTFSQDISELTTSIQNQINSILSRLDNDEIIFNSDNNNSDNNNSDN